MARQLATLIIEQICSLSLKESTCLVSTCNFM